MSFFKSYIEILVMSPFKLHKIIFEHKHWLADVSVKLQLPEDIEDGQFGEQEL